MLATINQFVAPCDNLVSLYDNTGSDIADFEFVAPCDNLVVLCDYTESDIAVLASGVQSDLVRAGSFLIFCFAKGACCLVQQPCHSV